MTVYHWLVAQGLWPSVVSAVTFWLIPVAGAWVGRKVWADIKKQIVREATVQLVHSQQMARTLENVEPFGPDDTTR